MVRLAEVIQRKTGMQKKGLQHHIYRLVHNVQKQDENENEDKRSVRKETLRNNSTISDGKHRSAYQACASRLVGDGGIAPKSEIAPTAAPP